MDSKIIILGKEYSSLDEVPPELQSVYEEMNQVLGDKNGDGLPDIFEGKIWKLNPEKIEQLREIAQRIKGQNPGSPAATFQTMPSSPKRPSPDPVVPTPPSNNTFVFTLGVLAIGIFLLVGVIYLYRLGYFH